MATDKRKDSTVTWLDSLEPAPTGKRVVWWDLREPGLGIRITDKGVISFFVLKRVSGRKTPERITLGRYPALGLAEARRKADGALRLMGEGKHPREEAERQRAAEEAAKAAQEDSTFRAWAERFKAGHLEKNRPTGKLRSRAIMWRDMRLDFLPYWGDKPVGWLRSIGRA